MAEYDDILVTGTTEEEHLAYLEEVYFVDTGGRFAPKERETCLPLALCCVPGPSNSWPRTSSHPRKTIYRIDDPQPKNVAELKLYNYWPALLLYSKSFPNLSTVLAPLYHLLKKQEPWQWTCKQSELFINNFVVFTIIWSIFAQVA